MAEEHSNNNLLLAFLIITIALFSALTQTSIIYISLFALLFLFIGYVMHPITSYSPSAIRFNPTNHNISNVQYHINNNNKSILLLRETCPKLWNAIWRLLELVIRDFVEWWYLPNVGPDVEYVTNNIRESLEYSLENLVSRIEKVDWSSFFFRHVIYTLVLLLRMHRKTILKIESEHPNFLNINNKDKKRIFIQYLKKDKYITSFLDISSHSYLRELLEAFLSRVLPPNDFQCSILRSFLREILLNNIIIPIMEYANPYYANLGIIAIRDFYLKLDSDAREQEQKSSQILVEDNQSLFDKTNDWRSKRILKKKLHNTTKIVINDEASTTTNSAQQPDTTKNFKLNIQIRNHVIAWSSSHKPFVLYEIEISNEKHNWIVQRRFSQFQYLHSNLKKNDLMPSHYNALLPRKDIFRKLQHEFIQERKDALQQYLRSLLGNKKILKSEIISIFLEFPSSFYSLNSSSSSHHLQDTTNDNELDMENSSSFVFKDAKFTKESSHRITEPLYMLCDELLLLTGRSMLRRQMTWLATHIIKFSFDGRINEMVSSQINAIINLENVNIIVQAITDVIWPNGTYFEQQALPTEEEKEKVTEEAMNCMIEIIPFFPSYILTLLGKESCVSGSLRLFQFFQTECFLEHFTYCILDQICIVLFPDLEKVILNNKDK